MGMQKCAGTPLLAGGVPTYSVLMHVGSGGMHVHVHVGPGGMHAFACWIRVAERKSHPCSLGCSLCLQPAQASAEVKCACMLALASGHRS